MIKQEYTYSEITGKINQMNHTNHNSDIMKHAIFIFIIIAGIAIPSVAQQQGKTKTDSLLSVLVSVTFKWFGVKLDGGVMRF